LQTRDILHKLPPRIILIFYSHGFRGHAVTRILSCHPEAHWESKWSSGNDERDNPLSFPEHVSGFEFYRAEGVSIKKASTFVHTGYYLEIGRADDSLRENFLSVYNLVKLLKDTKSDKYIFLNTHPHQKAVGLEKVERPKKVILYSELHADPRYGLWPDVQLNSLSPQENALNINIDKLFSSDYTEFEDEYLKAVKYFDFTPRINAVRAFILRYIERERHVFNS
jgi:hypothetical protein